MWEYYNSKNDDEFAFGKTSNFADNQIKYWNLETLEDLMKKSIVIDEKQVAYNDNLILKSIDDCLKRADLQSADETTLQCEPEVEVEGTFSESDLDQAKTDLKTAKDDYEMAHEAYWDELDLF